MTKYSNHPNKIKCHKTMDCTEGHILNADYIYDNLNLQHSPVFGTC